jgi:hypothetical protein
MVYNFYPALFHTIGIVLALLALVGIGGCVVKLMLLGRS